MHACAYAVYGIEKITFHRASNVRAACVAAKAVKTQSEILAQLKILQKLNLIEDLEKNINFQAEKTRERSTLLFKKNTQQSLEDF